MGSRHVVFIVPLLLASNPVFAGDDVTSGRLLTTEKSLLALSQDAVPAHAVKVSALREQRRAIPRQHFDSLADALLQYEAIQNSGLWQPFAAGPLLRQGDRHTQVSQLKAHLQWLGDLPRQTALKQASQQFDHALQQALRRFQTRHSINVDGVLGPQTRALLNVPPWQRIDQLALNIYRQQQADINDAVYLHVNLPEYRLRFYQSGEPLLEMRTIVGKRTRQTPEFSASVTRLVINPDWNVPKSIAYEDILPKLKEDPDFLHKRNLRVVSGWQVPRFEVPYTEVDFDYMYQGADYFRFWEPPGERNTLGQMKFQLSANNSIYLHDTQQKYLFDAQARAFSSGCIRLEKPRELANMLMQVANQWTPEVLGPLFETDETIKLRIKKKINLHVTYWTAWLDENGVLHFADDIYRRDSADFFAMQQAQRKALQKVDMVAN